MNVTIDPKLKTKCPRTALGCVTARVQAGVSPAALLDEMKAGETEIQNLPIPRSLLASPEVESTRMAYKALGKDPSRYRGSAEALLRRVVAGEGLPVFCDAAGPHGSATSDSERTMVTAATTQVLAIIVSFGGPESLERCTQRLGALLQQYAAGTDIVTNIVN